MKKKRVIFYCSILFMFCQYLPVAAISAEQKAAIVDNCEVIRESLKNVQRLDSRTRVFFGSHYETVLAKFITPLNVRMVENNLPNIELLENQNDFAAAKLAFSTNFVVYQQSLEDLIVTDCAREPEKFYEKLVLVREKRETMVYSIAKLKGIILENIGFAKKLRESL